MKGAKKVSQEAIRVELKKINESKPTKPGTDIRKDMREVVHLLQVSQVELEHQNQELRIAERELEASRSKYVDLFDFSPIPYFALDLAGVIKEVNLSAARMFAVDRNKLIGRHFTEYVPYEGRRIFTSFLKEVFQSPEKASCTLRMTNREKRVFDVLLDGVRSNYTLETEPRCQIAVIDVTEYKKLEKLCEELSEELESLKNAKDKFKS
jgi:PAS domain S-box-containing protein